MTSGPENLSNGVRGKKSVGQLKEWGHWDKTDAPELAIAQNDPVFPSSEPVSIGEIEDFIDANAEWAAVNHRLQQDIAAGRVKPEVRA